ncbi:MAG: hypothetical protein H6739_04325 [Alphaproteobacteria bacterium]|nr:hypothetical protein [Alphaproteobacteria bacterium]
MTLLLALLLLLPVFAAQPAQPALPPNAKASGYADRSIEDWARDLRGGSRAERKLAARELRRQTRDVSRAVVRAPEGSIRQLEAWQTWDDLYNGVVRPCTVGLTTPEIARPCAQMLGMLQATEATPALEAALAAEPRRRTARAIRAALDSLAEASP